MDFQPSEKAQAYVQRVARFITQHITPIEKQYWQDVERLNPTADWTTWQHPPIIEVLKARAKAEGLWNLFVPEGVEGSAGLTTLEYSFVAEVTGHSILAPEVFNCNAPDSGNMEVLWCYGSDEQKEQWLKPLMAGEIRSAFCMTEPDVASSDATNLEATAILDGDEVVLNGTKWWSSGIGDPRTKILIFMGKTPDANKGRHHQHTMVLVPVDAPGVTIERMVPVFGMYDAPHGHGQVRFENVRLPKSAVIKSVGAGFEIAQGRLGPGRIHHCMRCLGAAEEALSLAIRRAQRREAFGRPIIKLGGNREKIAQMRIAIDQARLLTLFAAWKMAKYGTMLSLTEVSAIKVVAPNVLQQVVDFAIQIHGGAGVSNDTLLPAFFAQARSLRLADGPDEVHLGMVTKMELMKYQ